MNPGAELIAQEMPRDADYPIGDQAIVPLGLICRQAI
jgi:hypothetical protein